MKIGTMIERAQKHALEAADIAGKTLDSDISTWAEAAAKSVDRANACSPDEVEFIRRLCSFAKACADMCMDAA